MHPRAYRVLAALAVVALIATACGDSGGDDTTAATQAQTPGSTTATTPADTAPMGTAANTTVTFGTLPDDIPGIDDECLAIANLFVGMGTVGMALTGQSDMDEAQAQALFDEAKSQLPSALHGDIDIMGNAIIGFFQAVAATGLDFTNPETVATASVEQFAALDEASELIDTDEVQQAIDNLSAYGEAQCPGG